LIELGLSPEYLGIARAGEAVDHVLCAVGLAVHPGVTVGELDAIAGETLARLGARSSMKGHSDGQDGGAFPLSLSVCVNDEISGASDPGRVLERGDLVTTDLAASLDGWHADAAHSWCIGGASADPRRAALAAASRSVAQAGVMFLNKGQSWQGALDLMHRAAQRHGVVMLDGFFGHGIGRAMHTEPALPCHGAGLDSAGTEQLARGQAITIEPVVAWADTGFVRDGWLDRTADGSDACFTEVTVVLEQSRSVVVAGRDSPGSGEEKAVN